MANWFANIHFNLGVDSKKIGFKEYRSDPKLKTLKSNRNLNPDLVQDLVQSIIDIGSQISPITVCKYNGEADLVEDGLVAGDLCIIDGQHRYRAIQIINEARKINGDPLLTYKVFLNDYINLNQAIVDHANNVRQGWSISDRINEYAMVQPQNPHAIQLFEVMKKHSNSNYGSPSNMFSTSSLVHLFIDEDKTGTNNPHRAIQQKTYKTNTNKGEMLMDICKHAAAYDGWESRAYTATFAKTLAHVYMSNSSVWDNDVFFRSLSKIEWNASESEFKKNFIRAYNSIAHSLGRHKLDQT